MRRVIKNGAIVQDDWQYPPAPTGEHAVLTLAEFLAARAAGDRSARGVKLSPADTVEELGPRLEGVELVCVEFPSVGEGRGYTQGRLLRERFKYTGELRAVGNDKGDQLYFLARCGFDAFDLPETEDLQDALKQLERFTVAYQRTTGGVLHPAQRV